MRWFVIITDIMICKLLWNKFRKNICSFIPTCGGISPVIVWCRQYFGNVLYAKLNSYVELRKLRHSFWFVSSNNKTNVDCFRETLTTLAPLGRIYRPPLRVGQYFVLRGPTQSMLPSTSVNICKIMTVLYFHLFYFLDIT